MDARNDVRDIPGGKESSGFPGGYTQVNHMTYDIANGK